MRSRSMIETVVSSDAQLGDATGRRYDFLMADRERISVELDAEVASLLRPHAVDADVTEGEIVERALDLRALVALASRRRCP